MNLHELKEYFKETKDYIKSSLFGTYFIVVDLTINVNIKYKTVHFYVKEILFLFCLCL